MFPLILQTSGSAEPAGGRFGLGSLSRAAWILGLQRWRVSWIGAFLLGLSEESPLLPRGVPGPSLLFVSEPESSLLTAPSAEAAPSVQDQKLQPSFMTPGNAHVVVSSFFLTFFSPPWDRRLLSPSVPQITFTKYRGLLRSLRCFRAHGLLKVLHAHCTISQSLTPSFRNCLANMWITTDRLP